MVTIEQKLSMFSKLLHRSMNEKFTEEMKKLRSEYEIKLQNNKDAVDKEAEAILNRAHKKAEAESTELISKIRINMKKDYMAVKERLFGTMTEHLTDRIKSYVRSPEYGDYMAALAKRLNEEDPSSEPLTIYMTAADLKNYGERLKQEWRMPHGRELTMEIADDSMIGGFIAVNSNSGIRMDFSIKALLEDNRPYMMQTLFQALEAGETDGTE